MILRTALTRRSLRQQALAALLLASVAIPVLSSVASAQDGETVSTEFAPGQGHTVDYDRDGLTDVVERQYGLDPYRYDTDGDIIGDGDEFSNRYGYSDPLDYDTDNDRLADGEEVFIFFSDPWLVDTDFDGKDDGFEARNGSNPRDPKS
jgi:hypothetical protein